MHSLAYTVQPSHLTTAKGSVLLVGGFESTNPYSPFLNNCSNSTIVLNRHDVENPMFLECFFSMLLYSLKLTESFDDQNIQTKPKSFHMISRKSLLLIYIYICNIIYIIVYIHISKPSHVGFRRFPSHIHRFWPRPTEDP